MLSLHDLKILLDYNPKNGEFTRRVTSSPNAIKGESCGAPSSPVRYGCIYLDGRSYYSHRVAWFYTYGYFPKNQLDHIDGDKSNNSISNLREVTNQENSKNRALHTGNTSGHSGVSWSKREGKWKVYINNDNKKANLGTYKYKSQAVFVRRLGDIIYGYHVNNGRARVEVC